MSVCPSLTFRPSHLLYICNSTHPEFRPPACRSDLLLDISINIFPFRICINFDACDPIALSFAGVASIGSATYMQFYITLKVVPGYCRGIFKSTCADSDVIQIEFNVGESVVRPVSCDWK